jgi:hypothetical protein
MHHLMVCCLVRTKLERLLHHLMLLFYWTVAALVAHGRSQLVIENIVVFEHLVWCNEGLAVLSEVWWHLMVVGDIVW